VEALIGPFEEVGYPGITPRPHPVATNTRPPLTWVARAQDGDAYPLDQDEKWQIEARNVLPPLKKQWEGALHIAGEVSTAHPGFFNLTNNHADVNRTRNVPRA
jgi:hypothetical protein